MNGLEEETLRDFPGEGGRLFVVATPIGNRDDFSPRARRILESCDLVLAEDTRRLFALTRDLGLRVRRAESFHDHNEEAREAALLARLKKGETLALVSDAGTPLVADPGFRLVAACRREGIPVHPVPGPSAPVAALSAAGIAPLPYSFLGFLPRDGAGRRRLFEAFARTPGTLVFFERKDRLAESLREARALLGPRQVAVCRELTKVHEEFLFLRLEDEAGWPDDLLGEVTVLIGPPESRTRASEEDIAELARRSDPRAGTKALARDLLPLAPGWSLSEIYALIVRVRAERRG